MLIPTAKNTRNITDFRKNPDSVLEAVQGKSDPLYLFRGSTPKAVVIDIEEYARIREIIEDYQDSLRAQAIERNPEPGGISLKEFLSELDVQNHNQAQRRKILRKTNHGSKG